ncbi:hypothetical protein H9L39_08706 [Fusarium oxysporum f. sp. albedinis]|nr:hypothetical protein H9L39_08706 [Fusarium oxysporum f. sp. albedinis]
MVLLQLPQKNMSCRAKRNGTERPSKLLESLHCGAWSAIMGTHGGGSAIVEGQKDKEPSSQGSLL